MASAVVTGLKNYKIAYAYACERSTSWYWKYALLKETWQELEMETPTFTRNSDSILPVSLFDGNVVTRRAIKV